MRIAGALASVLLALVTSAASAAPIQGVIDAQTGAVSFSGLTGEIFIAVRAPEQFLLPANFLGAPWGHISPDGFPGEIGILGLSGIFVDLNFGNVVVPGLATTQLAQIRMAYQAGFTSPIIETPSSFVASAANIPAGQAGLFVIIPEPASLTLIALMMGALLTAVRFQGSRQHCLAACSRC
jgi:hypothetical protein